MLKMGLQCPLTIAREINSGSSSILNSWLALSGTYIFCQHVQQKICLRQENPFPHSFRFYLYCKWPNCGYQLRNTNNNATLWMRLIEEISGCLVLPLQHHLKVVFGPCKITAIRMLKLPWTVSAIIPIMYNSRITRPAALGILCAHL